MEEVSEEERRALRGSKFAPLPPPPSYRPPRQAHPGGVLTTNKAAALAKFLERKTQEPDGLSSINPNILEMAIKNAQDTLKSSGGVTLSGRIIRHVSSFDDDSEVKQDAVDDVKPDTVKKRKKKKKKKKANIEICS